MSTTPNRAKLMLDMFYGEHWHCRNIMSDQPDSLDETICCFISLLCCNASKLSHKHQLKCQPCCKALGKECLAAACCNFQSLRLGFLSLLTFAQHLLLPVRLTAFEVAEKMLVSVQRAIKPNICDGRK